MTSDAKIGLLLGLVFIFLITFVINGIPGFSKDTNNNELSTNMVSFENRPPGLAAKERKARQTFGPAISVEKTQGKFQAQPKENNLRFTAELSKPTLAMKDLSKIGEVTSVQPLTAAAKAAKDANRKAKSSGSALPKIYVVIDGDSLAVIAMKVYGYQHGNKRINITRIFQANRGILKSPDEIYVDQRLVIPPLSESQSGEDKIARLFCPASFERAESTGQRQIVTDSGQAEENRRHVVQEGDSLWQIAAEQLSDGTRYHEIAELNSGILEDEDNLVIGMCLKLPRR